MKRLASPRPSGTESRGGFSLVEVIIALVILAVGVLGLAGTTAYIVRQITLADLLTERAAALQTTVEKINATPLMSLSDGSDSVGVFGVKWAVNRVGQSATVTIVTMGPGLSGNPPMLGPNVADTFEMTVLSNE